MQGEERDADWAEPAMRIPVPPRPVGTPPLPPMDPPEVPIDLPDANGPTSPPQPTRWIALVLFTLLCVAAWLGLFVAILLAALLITSLAAAPLSELMQQTGGLEPTPFHQAFRNAAVVAAGVTMLCVGRRALRKPHPWWPLLALLLAGLAGTALLFGIWIDGESPPGALAAFTGLICLVGFVVVAPALATISAGRWIVGRFKTDLRAADAPVTTTLALSLCAFAPFAMLAGMTSMFTHGYRDGTPDPPWTQADGLREGLRLLLADLAYGQTGPRPERPISGLVPRPGAHYSATGPVRPKTDPQWACHLKLRQEPDPSNPSQTSEQICAQRLERAGHPDPENAAADLIVSVCARQRDDPVQYYSKACSNKRTDIFRRTTLDSRAFPDSPDEPIDRRDIRRCLNEAVEVQLTLREWQAVRLRADDASSDEIAEALGVTKDNARQIVSRTLAKLKARCQYLWYE